MNPERFARVEELFDELLLLDAPARERRLDELSTGDAWLRDEVRALLASDAGETTDGREPLERVVERALDEVTAGREARTRREALGLCGRQLGSWRLTELIDSGGMGSVYAAVRADDAHGRRVAVKVVRGGALDRAGRERFERERDALASLDHPGVARLIDCGTTDEGLPFLVMDFVEGERIDVWCASRRVTVPERIELFLAVCEAVQHAHGKLIVHRDIKPANVLVTADGTPKLLDFGIAKLLEVHGDKAATARGFFTLSYASPEQLVGAPVSTATDVYSLGVLLFELLAGRRPFRSKGLPTHKFVQRICEEEPPHLWDALRSLGEGACDFTHSCRTTPTRLRRFLRGDLDNIVRMAMRKEPERRYGSVEQLRADLSRHLSGHPVRARPATLRYRAAKLVRRKAGVLSLAALLVVVGGASLLNAWQSHARERGLHGEINQLSLAIRQGLRANPFLFEGSASHAALVEQTDAAASLLSRVEFGTPQEEFAFLTLVLESYQRLRLGDRKRGLLQRRLEVAEEIGDELLVAEALASLGRHDEAFAIRSRRLTPPHEDLARSLNAMASLARARGDYGRAHELHSRATAMLRVLSDVAPRTLVASIQNWARSYFEQGDNESAIRLLDEALAIARRYPSDESRLRAVLTQRGWVLQDMARYDEAYECLDEALGLMRRNLPEGHPNLYLATIYLGLLQKDRGEFEMAESHLLEAERLGEAFAEPYLRDSWLPTGWFALAKLYADWARWEEAEAYARRAFAARRAHTPDHAEVSDVATLWGRILLELGRPEEALEPLELAFAMREEGMPWGRWERHKTASVLGLALLRLGRLERARPLLEERVRLVAAGRGPDHYRTAQAYWRLVELYEHTGEAERAREALAKITARAREHRIVETTLRTGRAPRLRGGGAEPRSTPHLESRASSR